MTVKNVLRLIVVVVSELDEHGKVAMDLPKGS